jgi:hypothetical protein
MAASGRLTLDRLQPGAALEVMCFDDLSVGEGDDGAVAPLRDRLTAAGVDHEERPDGLPSATRGASRCWSEPADQRRGDLVGRGGAAKVRCPHAVG